MVDLFEPASRRGWEGYGKRFMARDVALEIEIVLRATEGRIDHGDIVEVSVVIIEISDMKARGVCGINPDIIVNCTVRSFAEFYAHSDAEVFRQLIV